MTRGYSAVGLFSPKSSVNIGGAMRACSCYGASLIAINDRRGIGFRHATDTHKTWRHTPTMFCEDLFDVIPVSCVPVAVELIEGAESLVTYKHPHRAMYIFGPEDSTLGKRVLDRVRDVIQVPAVHGCMNLAATVNVVLYDRAAKGQRNG